MALVDSEVVGHYVIRENFLRIGEPDRSQAGDVTQRYACPQCNVMCEEHFAEYSISMSRSYFRFLDTPEMATYGLFLVGIRGFSHEDFAKVHDFHQAGSSWEFLAYLGIQHERSIAPGRIS
ncbi:MAG: hypothetical protein ACTHK7_15180 [Aureliella sp.]